MANKTIKPEYGHDSVDRPLVLDASDGLNAISVLPSAQASKYGDRYPFHEVDRLGQRRIFQGVSQVVSTPGSSRAQPTKNELRLSHIRESCTFRHLMYDATQGKQRQRIGATPTKSEDRMLRVLHLNINRSFRDSSA